MGCAGEFGGEGETLLRKYVKFFSDEICITKGDKERLMRCVTKSRICCM